MFNRFVNLKHPAAQSSLLPYDKDLLLMPFSDDSQTQMVFSNFLMASETNLNSLFQ
jgi:hypothetical protein